MLRTRGIADGFACCLGIHDSIPGSFWSYALEQMALIRQARTYRPYWFRLPEDRNLQLPGYSSYEYQAHFKPGTWIWGLQFLDTDQFGNETGNAGRMSIQITETYSGMPLFSEFEDVNAFRAMRQGDIRSPRIFLLTSPVVIAAPGDVDIEVCNLTGQTSYWQVVIFTAEPYDTVEA